MLIFSFLEGSAKFPVPKKAVPKKCSPGVGVLNDAAARRR